MTMRSRLIVTAALLGMCASVHSETDQRSVFVGRILYVQPKTAEDIERELAGYEHNNRQYMVVEVERVLLGSPMKGPVLLGIGMGHSGAVGILTALPSRPVLDTSFWRIDSRVVFAATPDSTRNHCRPPVLFPSKEAAEANDFESGTYFIDELNAFRTAPVYCLADADLFSVRDGH